MYINSDHFFAIGSSHKVCEDYAESLGTQGIASLGDGCSLCLDGQGKPITAHTDLGSRLLVRCAQAIQAKYGNWITQDDLVPRIIERIEDRRISLDLSRNTLSSTLMTAIAVDDSFVMTVCGDGAWAVRDRKTLDWHVFQIEFESGCPYYLRYELDLRDKSQFVKDCVTSVSLNYFIVESGDVLNFPGEWPLPPVLDVEPYSIDRTYPFSDYDRLVMFSDGLGSFSKRDPDSCVPTSVPIYEAIKPFLAFHNTRGEFVNRRASKALAAFAKDGITHSDDFSMVALVAEDE